MLLFGENRNGAFHCETKISCDSKGCLVGEIIVFKHFFFFLIMNVIILQENTDIVI